MLSPSERTRLITEIGTRLSNQDWPLIDLTLHQFSLPTEYDWRGTPFTYVIEMVQRAPDSVLLELATHLGYNVGVGSGSIETSFWAPGTFRLFITHLATYNHVAANLQHFLAKYHVSAFVAHKDIEPTREWMDEIELALSTADGLLFLAGEARFIIITHNKITIEVAGCLYGVTVEEKGVSKLVAVKLDDVQPAEPRRATA